MSDTSKAVTPEQMLKRAERVINGLGMRNAQLTVDLESVSAEAAELRERIVELEAAAEKLPDDLSSRPDGAPLASE